MRHMIIAIALVAAFAAESQALGSFTIKSAHLTKQLSGAYRLRVDVDWDRTAIDVAASGGPGGYIWPAQQAIPKLYSLNMTTPTDAFNFLNSWGASAGLPEESEISEHQLWTANASGSLGMHFGYDFYAPENLTSRAFDFNATVIHWGYVNILPENIVRPDAFAYTTTSGSFTAQVVPEPSTLLLLGLGLAFVRRKR